MTGVDVHRLAEERSVALHAAVAAAIRRDPGVVARAQRRVDGWLREGPTHPAYARAWRELLALPREQLCARLVERTEKMAALRQCSPFAGALDPRERWRILRDVRARVTGE